MHDWFLLELSLCWSLCIHSNLVNRIVVCNASQRAEHYITHHITPFFFQRREPHTKKKKKSGSLHGPTVQLRISAVKVVNSARATVRNAWAANIAIEWLPYSNKFGHKSEMKVM